MNTKITLRRKDIYTGNLVLVNPSHCLQETFFFHGNADDIMLPACDSMPQVLLHRAAVTLLSELMAKLHGWEGIVPVSGWRSLAAQQRIWNSSLEESGLEFTRKYVAVPGHSEHQTGLAIDLGLKKAKVDFICPDFPDSGICLAFRREAAKYGFILRYPIGKETITGIGHEPWHFRYVGIPHAEIMEEYGFTLEEYIEFLKDYAYASHPFVWNRGREKIEISYVDMNCPHARGTDTSVCAEGSSDTLTLEFSDIHPYTVSGNNVDGFILTEWRQQNAKAI